MKLKQLLITLVFAAFSSSVFAGFTQPAPVVVDTEAQSAFGDMASARFSDNEFEFIGCGIRKISISPEETISFGFCQANAGGEEDAITCTTQNADLLAGIDAIADFSFVTFSWDENLECTRIGNSTQSFYLPNFKLKKVKKNKDDDDDDDD